MPERATHPIRLAELRGFRAGVQQCLTGKSQRNPYPAHVRANGKPSLQCQEGTAWVGAWSLVVEVFCQGAQRWPRAFWRHNRSDGHYTEVARAELQSSGGPISEGARLVIYQGVDGRFWVRPEAEFEDGRFTRLPQKSHITPLKMEATTLMSEITEARDTRELFNALYNDGYADIKLTTLVHSKAEFRIHPDVQGERAIVMLDEDGQSWIQAGRAKVIEQQPVQTTPPAVNLDSITQEQHITPAVTQATTHP